MAIDFRKLSTDEAKKLGAALGRNAAESKPLHLDPLTTGWIPGQDEISDESVIDSIKSVPCHYEGQ